MLNSCIPLGGTYLEVMAESVAGDSLQSISDCVTFQYRRFLGDWGREGAFMRRKSRV